MGRVMMRCPETGALIPTDIVTDERSFRECEFENTLVKCPECDQRHALTCEEAIFREEEDEDEGAEAGASGDR